MDVSKSRTRNIEIYMLDVYQTPHQNVSNVSPSNWTEPKCQHRFLKSHVNVANAAKSIILSDFDDCMSMVMAKSRNKLETDYTPEV